MIKTNTRDRAVTLLRNRPVWLTIATISIETTIPAGWIKALSAGRIEDPGVNRVETLISYLETKGCK